MLNHLTEITKHTLMITSFVFVMMLVVEYINILTEGKWQEKLTYNRWVQYLFAAILGATPGCLGAFVIVAMYSHRVVSLGALVTVMIATSGDEAFVMFAMIPKTAAIMTVILIFIGIAGGIITDIIFKNKLIKNDFELPLHEKEDCNCFPAESIISQLKHCTLARGVLLLTLSFLFFMFIFGSIGPQHWNWIKFTILFSISLSLFIVLTVPDHFLEEHLWEHIAKKHTFKIFIWTFIALFATHLIIDNLNLENIIKENKIALISIAGAMGIIPESGPHLIFTTLFSKQIIPFSVLLVSSIVQDGHGMIPLLGFSKKDFIIVKLINLTLGLIVGFILLSIGY